MIMTPKHMTSFKTINVILSILNKADFSLENALVTRIFAILPYTQVSYLQPSSQKQYIDAQKELCFSNSARSILKGTSLQIGFSEWEFFSSADLLFTKAKSCSTVALHCRSPLLLCRSSCLLVGRVSYSYKTH